MGKRAKQLPGYVVATLLAGLPASRDAVLS